MAETILPPGFVRLDDHKVSVAEFLRTHGGNLRAVPSAEIAVEVPAFTPSDELKDLLKGTVSAVSGILAVFIIRNGAAAKIIGGAIGSAAGGYMSRHLDTPKRVVTVRVSDLMNID